MRDVRHKYTSATLDFREDGLIKLDVTEADCREPVDVEQVNKVAAAALVDAKVTGCAAEEHAELVNVRLRAGLHLVGRHVCDGTAFLVTRALWIDTICLTGNPNLKPLAYVRFFKADATETQDKTPNSFSRISLR
eukprot:6184185-Pleurochrysis_carterae.AAC.1